MSKKKLKALIFGPQGSGKGTQGRLLAARFEVPLVGAGDLFRAEVESGSGLGKLADQYVTHGCLAPDELVNGIMSRQLKSMNLKNGFVLDGFPRTVDQAIHLQRILPVNIAIFLKISDDLAVKRLRTRLQCPKCRAVYNKIDAKPAKGDRCRIDGTKLVRRSDDNEETIRMRLLNFHFITEPMARFYRQKGLLLMIKGDQSIDYVEQVLTRKLAKLGFVP